MADRPTTAAPLRILIVAPHLPPDHVGGVEVYSQGLLRQYHARGHEVSAFAVEHVTPGATDACQVTRDDRDGYPVYRADLTVAGAFPLLSTHAPTTEWLEQHVRASQPDVMHVQSGYLLGAVALEVARRTGTPAVLTLHDYWFACPRVTLRHPSGELCSGPERPSKCTWCLTSDQRRHAVLDRLTLGQLSLQQDRSPIWQTIMGGEVEPVAARQRLLTGLLPVAAKVLAPVRFVAQQVAWAGLSPDRVILSRCGIPDRVRHERTPDGTLRLAYFGQIVPHKGVHLAIAAVRKLAGRAVSLTIHGPLDSSPEYAARLRELAGDDPRVIFAGSYRRDAQSELLAACDAVVVPSIWHEVAALTIQEAQAAGRPVVASTLGGSPELVTDGVDGLLFDPARADHLEHAITQLLDEPGLLARLAAAAPTPRSIDDEVTALLDLYASVRRPS